MCLEQAHPAPQKKQGNRRAYFLIMCNLVRAHYDELLAARTDELRGDMLAKLMKKTEIPIAKKFPKTRQSRQLAFEAAVVHLENEGLLPEPKPLVR